MIMRNARVRHSLKRGSYKIYDTLLSAPPPCSTLFERLGRVKPVAQVW